MTYDDWLTTPPEDYMREIGTVECPRCEGVGVAEDEDGKWQCHHCHGKGWLYDDDPALDDGDEEADE